MVNPFKTSPGLGAAYALQGIKGAVALFHAAPGCTFLGKVLLTQHLKEPMGLVGTDIKEMPTIMGGWDELKNKIIDVHKRFKPSLIGVIGTALSEVRGEDIEGIIANFKSQISDCKIVYIPCPDYMGNFGDGYAKAVEILVKEFVGARHALPLQDNQITILPSTSLTAGDIEEIKDSVSAFGLKPVVLPDLSLSMDGSKDSYSILPSDGITIDDINLIGQSSATIAIGKTMHKAGGILHQKYGIPLHKFDGLIGLEATDAFIKLLLNLSKKDAPANIRRWRRRLVDGMVDTHLIMADKKIAIGLDGDMVPAITAFCREMGIDTNADCGLQIADLEDLEDMAHDADIIIGNSHGKEIADRLGIPLLRMGFPVYDRFGETLKVRVGYRGTLNLLFEMANIFQEEDNGLRHRDYTKRQDMDTALYQEHKH